MKTWSKSDIVGLFFVVFGVIAFLFSNSSWLVSVSFMSAALVLLHSIYGARYDCAKFKEMLCHYQAILSCSSEGWIAWNTNAEYIGSSKKIKTFFGIKQSSDIRITDIVSALEPEDAELLSLNFSKLKKQGVNFVLNAKTLVEKNKIQIVGSRMIINNIETLLFWCSNITESSALLLFSEQKLVAAKQRIEFLQEILNLLQMPVWRRDENLKLTYCNKAYAIYLNTSIDKILENNLPLAPGNLFGHGHSLAESAKKTNRPQTVSCFVTVNGMRKKILINECPTVRGDLIGYSVDATTEEALAVNLDKVVTATEEVLENLSTAIIIFGENMRVKFFNSAYRQMMKLEPGWLRSNPTYGEVLDELRNHRLLSEQADYQAYKKSQLALFTSITSPIHEFIHLPNGKTLKLAIFPHQLGGLLFVYEDATDSLALQRKNNMLLAVHKETINNLYEGIMVYGSDNRLKVINKAMLQKIWKVSDDKLLADMHGMHMSEVLNIIKDDLDYDCDWQEFQENAISNLTDRIPKTGKLIKRDNSIIQFSYIPLPDGGHMHSFADITDTCMVEKAITEKNEALKMAQQMRLEFVSGISIELKEPLNVLVGFSELLLSQSFGILNDKQTKYCQCLLGASNQLHLLINNLLEMVSIDIDSSELDLSTFLVKDVLDEIIQNLEKRILEKNIDLIKNYSDHFIEFIGDRTRIKQSIYNMLIAAIRNAMFHGKIEVILAADDKNLKIIIKDDGVAVSAEENKISQRVFRRSPKFQRFGKMEKSGISMPLVSSLIELHGGTLKINSVALEGTSFVCTLPLPPKNSVGLEVNPSKDTYLLQAVNS